MNGAFTTPTDNGLMPPNAAFGEALFRPTGVEGVYGRTGTYEMVIERLGALLTEYRDSAAEVLRFPPVMSRRDLQKSGYLSSFPNLLGCVCALDGSEAEIVDAVERGEQDGGWLSALVPSDLVLVPAACYPVYPLVAAGGALPSGGLRFDVACDCFRREPSVRLDRLQSFRMREYVCIGSPDDVIQFRSGWIELGKAIADRLGLAARVVPANDPFFGRQGKMKGISQIHQSLKFELVVPIYSEVHPTACMSFNYHRSHFGATWAIRDHTGAAAHTGCVAFGMDRLAVALFARHGLDCSRWPGHVREGLSL